jgi:hypothetical protein
MIPLTTQHWLMAGRVYSSPKSGSQAPRRLKPALHELTLEASR